MPEWVGSGAQRHCIGQKELSFSLPYNGAETKIQFLRQRLSRARSRFTDHPPSATPPLRNRPHAGILPTCCSGALLFITPPSAVSFLPSFRPSFPLPLGARICFPYIVNHLCSLGRAFSSETGAGGGGGGKDKKAVLSVGDWVA